jgi:polyhydroxybutyrate depolymerase
MRKLDYGKCCIIILLILIPIISFAQVTGSFVFEGITRYYIVYVPQNYNGSTEIPLVFNLHGLTENMTQQMNYSGMNTVADSEGFIVVYPNGAGPYNSWNIGVSGSPNINDVGFINALIDTLCSHYNIDTSRIYSCGFSMGGFMSNRLACELSNRIAAIASVSGTMAQSIANSCIPNHHMPVLLIHGTADLIVPYIGFLDRLGVDTLIEHWTNLNNCTESDTILLPDLDTLDGCTVQKIIYTHCSDSVSVILFKVINGGHSWPGGDTSNFHLPPGYEIGNTNFDINASQEIWNFFNKDYLIAEVENYPEYPTEFSLFQNYPNPFNPRTKISWQSPASGWQTLKVYDVLGNEIETLVNEEKPAGTYEVTFDSHSGEVRNLPSGVYFYQLKSGSFVETKKMILLK